MKYQIKLIKKTNATHNVLVFTFEKPDGFIYKPGQFVQFKISSGGKDLVRSYSISCPPSKDYLEFCVKLVPDGKGSGWFQSLQVGDSAKISESKGHFTNLDIAKNYYIATGVGVAPIMAMLESISIEPANLVFGVREEKDIFWRERFENIKKTNPNFDYIITLSRAGDEYEGVRGRVVEHIKIDLSGQYYICGGVEVVKDVRTHLLSKGLNTKSIHMEIF